MALYHKWDVKNDFANVLQFLSLISDSLGSVNGGGRLWYITKNFSTLDTMSNSKIKFQMDSIIDGTTRFLDVPPPRTYVNTL